MLGKIGKIFDQNLKFKTNDQITLILAKLKLACKLKTEKIL